MFNRYILREVLTSWLGVTALLLVLLLTNEVARVLSRAADNQYPRSMVLELIGLGAVHNLTIIVPVGLLLGIVLALGRLYHDSEMSAALACGVSPARVYGPVLALALVLTAALSWLSLEVAPRAMAQVLNLRGIALRAGQFAPVAPGRFRTFGGGAAVVYAQGLAPDGTLTDVFVERSHNGVVEVALAERARHQISADGNTLSITLYHGERFTGVPGSAQFRIMYFTQHTIPVQMPPPVVDVSDLDAAPTQALLHSANRSRQAELQWRLALPVMCLVLAIIAVPLSRLRPRQGRYARFGLAVVLYLVYSNLVTAGRVWLDRGSVAPDVGLWWTHIAILALALLMLGTPRWLARLRHRDLPRAALAA
ncbi:MAG TPA: LPS export ABC transporter permease LptF [Steroidobacteraceae bacterium]|nr:LPS export ABC transporter permease LptF [Steroidobacteraceae bacterium]